MKAFKGMPRKNVKVHVICNLSGSECPKVTHIKRRAWSNAIGLKQTWKIMPYKNTQHIKSSLPSTSSYMQNQKKKKS